ncbi:glycosyltransferase family 2 protein [Paenibacillus piri]|nr:glycosyltransferase family A protein [Paenibacillus piri]
MQRKAKRKTAAVFRISVARAIGKRAVANGSVTGMRKRRRRRSTVTAGGSRKATRLRSAIRRGRSAAVPLHTASAAYQAGFRAGIADAAHLSIEQEPDRKKALNRHWLERVRAMRWLGPPWDRYVEAARGYVKGFFIGKKKPAPDWLMLPTAQSVAAIVAVMNEERTIANIMKQLNRLPFDEVFVIVNGTSDRSFLKARQASQAVIAAYPEPLGHDVGRALGAKLAQSDILLFLDGDMVLHAEDLISFIGGVESGLDVALNNITPYMRVFAKRDSVTHMKQFLNASLDRPDLEANSMTAVPHALSRKTVATLGIPNLMVPPKAQALAVHHGLRVGIAGSIDVIRSNKRRKHNTGKKNRLAELIIGDHLEALKAVGGLTGERLAFVDNLRSRAGAGGEV